MRSFGHSCTAVAEVRSVLAVRGRNTRIYLISFMGIHWTKVPAGACLVRKSGTWFLVGALHYGVVVLQMSLGGTSALGSNTGKLEESVG